jgi:hypothetical protein
MLFSLVFTNILKEHVTSILRVEVSQYGDVSCLYRKRTASGSELKRNEGKGSERGVTGIHLVAFHSLQARVTHMANLLQPSNMSVG